MCEFATLCGVDACIIIYGPDEQRNRPMEPETWPANPNEVRRIIKRYTDQSREERGKRTHEQSHFFKNRDKKLADDQLSKNGRKIGIAEFPTRDDRINGFFILQLLDLDAELDKKIEYVKSKTEHEHGRVKTMAVNDKDNLDQTFPQAPTVELVSFYDELGDVISVE